MNMYSVIMQARFLLTYSVMCCPLAYIKMYGWDEIMWDTAGGGGEGVIYCFTAMNTQN